MTQTTTAGGGIVTHRSGASRKLLTRKALAGVPLPAGDALEDVFPTSTADDAAVSTGTSDRPEGVEVVNGTDPAAATSPGSVAATTVPSDDVGALPAAAARELAGTPSEPATAEQHPAPPATGAWSDEDEATFQALTARRRAAGYQRRGRDVSGQLLRVGDIAPNAGTVVAAIVALVAERGTVGRSALLDAMAGATFPHTKARPQDRGWCQGYVAGAVRDGFLALNNGVAAGPEEVTR